jgi:hypothetical protein
MSREDLQQVIDRAIFKLHNMNWKQTQTAKLLEVSRDRIRQVIDAHSRGAIPPHNVGRPTIVTEDIQWSRIYPFTAAIMTKTTENMSANWKNQ